MKTVLAAALLITTALAGCASASVSSTPSTSPVAAASTGASAPPSSQAPSAGASGSACVFPAGATDWVPIPSGAGRCAATGFDPPFSFAPGDGWKWGSAGGIVALTRDNGTTAMRFYRYGGAVVPAYCVDPPATIAKSSATDVVAWLKTVKGLNVVVTERRIGTHAAWQLDLAASDPPSCSSGKAGLVALWTVAGQPIELPETLSGGEGMRVYLIEVPAGIIVARVSVQLDGPASYDQFLTDADTIFASLELP